MKQFFKWFFIVIGLLLIAAVGGHGLWTYQNHKAADASIAALVAAGEPMTPEDFEHVIGDEPNNPVPIYRKLIGQLYQKSDAFDAVDAPLVEPAFPLTDEESKNIDTLLATLPSFGPLMTQAATKTDPKWDIKLARPVIETSFPDFSALRAAARVQQFRTYKAAQAKDADAVARLLTEHERYARATMRYPSLFGSLMAIGVDRLGIDAVNQLCPSLDVGSPASARRAAYARLITLLLGDAPVENAYAMAVRYLRMEMCSTIQDMAAGAVSIKNMSMKTGEPFGNLAGLNRYLMRPLMYRDLVMGNAIYTSDIAFIQRTASPHAASVEASAMWDEVERNSRLHPFAAGLMHTLDSVNQMNNQILTQRHMAATGLAIRMYQADHSGKRPDFLGDLVPT